MGIYGLGLMIPGKDMILGFELGLELSLGSDLGLGFTMVGVRVSG